MEVTSINKTSIFNYLAKTILAKVCIGTKFQKKILHHTKISFEQKLSFALVSISARAGVIITDAAGVVREHSLLAA